VRVVALDPGGTTGWAFWDSDRSTFGQITEEGQLGPGSHHTELWVLLRTLDPDVVVCESFLYRQQANAVLVSCEYIGVVELFYQVKQKTFTGKKLVYQTASVIHGGGPWDDVALKKLGLWTRGARHANDAKLHLINYLAENKRGPRQTAWYYLLRDA